MAIPEAWVTVTVKLLKDVPGKVIGRPHVYALVTVGNRRLGRSRKITAAGTFDLAAEPQPWVVEMAVAPGQAIPVAVELWDDRGDTAPDKLADSAGSIPSPWDPKVIELGADPKIVVEVKTVRLQFGVSTATGRIVRIDDKTKFSATLRLSRAIVLELTEVLGLYKPGHAGTIAGRHKWASEYKPGYISDDNQGRIFINYDLNTLTTDPAWTNNKQIIQLTVKITLHGAVLPLDSKIKWTVIDPDDPTNDDPDCHREAGAYIDPDDYAGAVHRGAKADDNVRQQDKDGTRTIADLLDKRPPWEAVSGYALSDATDTGCKTEIKAATLDSKVTLHCPNIGGANLIVRADLIGSLVIPTLPAATGIMTMWKRLDVELVRMDGAHSLKSAITTVNQHLAPACAQLDFTDERTLPAAESRDPMAPSVSDTSSRSTAWINRAAVFSHLGQKGWFCLASAKAAHPTAPPATVYDSSTSGAAKWSIRLRPDRESIELDKPLALPGPVTATFTWSEATGSGPVTRTMAFLVDRAIADSPVAGHTELPVRANDIQRRFTGDDSDGSIDHAHSHELWFFPKRRLTRPAGTWAASSTAVPDTAKLVLKTRGGVAGISPSVIDGGKDFFAGRTIVFTFHRAYSSVDSTGRQVPVGDFDAKILSTVIHEFTHAFGMPHKCGFHDFRTPRTKTCFMNYGNTMMIDPTTEQMVFGTDGKTGDDLCARHMMEVRRVHLEDNKGLKW